MKKTQGVYLLVAEVLRAFDPPYSQDIIEDVFIAIESNENWKKQYDDLSGDLRSWVVNNWIGQYVKEITGLTRARQVDAKRAKIVKSYSKLT